MDGLALLTNPPPARLANIASRLSALEQQRTNDLFKRRAIGRVTSQKLEVDFHISVRKVNFKWQRGNKIGQWCCTLLKKLSVFSCFLLSVISKRVTTSNYFKQLCVYMLAIVCETGEGQFGKVYTAVNMETANLMAMKEVRETCTYSHVKNTFN